VPDVTKPIVDVDDPSTWPKPIADRVDALAEDLRDTTEYANDLAVPYEESDDFLRMFDGYLVRAYHCTRLLPHERTMIHERGLRVSGADLVNERIEAAHAVGAITDEERSLFLSGHVFAYPDWSEQIRIREKQVCLIVSEQLFDHGASGLDPLLTTWGGEVIYFPLDKVHGARLKSMGAASIVVAHVDVAAAADRDKIKPGLDRLMVGKVLGLEDLGH
jgi:hypothetical protein